MDMKYETLPHTELNVSKICLGTMTFGEQNNEIEAHQQLNFAFENGVNFIDTAEMYPVPPSGTTQGLSELYIGNWLKQTKKREQTILATKVSGPGGRNSNRKNISLDRRNIQLAINDSLERLQTDYIDLYQIHWPQRKTNTFGQLNYPYPDEQSEVALIETLEAMNELVVAGKVRHIGISNETPWGTMSMLHLAEKHNLSRPVSIQNPYNLLNRSFEAGLSEICHQEELKLLAYSPLAFGCLSGKYLDNQKPKNARCTLHSRFSRYFTALGISATQEYINLAQEFDLPSSQMALAFVNDQPFLGSNIIGATNLDQLKENIESVKLNLSNELKTRIIELGIKYSNPCP
jgi:aryl-alcohol dehydrogenase-like predicted oxidoreductase